MARVEFSFEQDVLPVVKEWARQRFARDRDRETKRIDAESVAWELHQASPDAPPRSIAWYALRRVAADRQFRESARSITGPNPRRNEKPERDSLSLEAISRPGDDPAEIAAFRCDFAQWFQSLNERQRAVVEAFARGDRTHEVAETLGCTAGNVSQFRTRLRDNWEAFTA